MRSTMSFRIYKWTARVEELNRIDTWMGRVPPPLEVLQGSACSLTLGFHYCSVKKLVFVSEYVEANVDVFEETFEAMFSSMD